MDHIEKALKSACLPRFFLFRNLVIGKTGPNPFPGEALISCEWCTSATDYDELVVPVPPLPLGLRNRDVGLLGMLDAVSLEELAEERPRFDTTVHEFRSSGRTTPSDLELFGVRYTILLLVPNDQQTVVKYLVDSYQSIARKRGKMNPRVLHSFWDRYMDRLWPYPATNGNEIVPKVTDLFKGGLNELPGVSQVAWETSQGMSASTGVSDVNTSRSNQ